MVWCDAGKLWSRGGRLVMEGTVLGASLATKGIRMITYSVVLKELIRYLLGGDDGQCEAFRIMRECFV